MESDHIVKFEYSRTNNFNIMAPVTLTFDSKPEEVNYVRSQIILLSFKTLGETVLNVLSYVVSMYCADLTFMAPVTLTFAPMIRKTVCII